MKGFINTKGFLFIERAGEMRSMVCPYSTSEEGKCGDWCPLFEEPSPTNESTGLPPWILTICQDKNIYFNEFEDLR